MFTWDTTRLIAPFGPDRRRSGSTCDWRGCPTPPRGNLRNRTLGHHGHCDCCWAVLLLCPCIYNSSELSKVLDTSAAQVSPGGQVPEFHPCSQSHSSRCLFVHESNSKGYSLPSGAC